MISAARKSNSTAGETRPAAHPWRRLWARLVDYTLFQFLLILTLSLFAPDLLGFLDSEDPLYVFVISSLITAILWIIPEAILLSSFGTTAGKWLLGIEIRTPGGGIPDLECALRRSFLVWVFGDACGLYPLSLLTWRKGYRDLSVSGMTRWDRAADCTVIHRPLRPAWVIVAASLVLMPDSVTIWSEQVEGDYRAQVNQQLTQLSTNVRVSYPESRFGDARPAQIFQLARGQVHQAAEHLNGGTIAVVGGCDEDCLDLDIVVLDPNGREVGRDDESDPNPVVVISPVPKGKYTIMVIMHDCQGEECYVGYQMLKSPSVLPQEWAGTGFVVDPRGAILTAHHVVDGATAVRVKFLDGRMFDATVERHSQTNDLAVLRVDVETPNYISLAPPGTTRVGDWIFTVGFPATQVLGDEAKLTEGSVTSLSGQGGEAGMLQISAPIQPGNSGGAVVNHRGQVVGVITSAAAPENFLAETGTLPQLVNWATKAEIALTLTDARSLGWTATTREQAIERARTSAVQVIAVRE